MMILTNSLETARALFEQPVLCATCNKYYDGMKYKSCPAEITVTDPLQGMIDKNGVKYQMGVCIEELAELMKELTKHLRDKGSAMHTLEEVADVEVCLAQLKLMFPGAQEKVDMFKRYKIERLDLLYLRGGER